MGFIWKLRSGSAFLQKCYLLWFSGMSCPLSFPKETVQKVFFHNETLIFSSAVSCCDSGIHCFTSKTKTFKNHLLVSTTCTWLMKTQKTITTSVLIISHFNRVFMWNGMWRQRNIGYILFGRTHFPFRFSDDLNDFVLNRDTFILRADVHLFHACTNHEKSWRILNMKGLAHLGGHKNKQMIIKHVLFVSSGVCLSPQFKNKRLNHLN